MVVNLPLRLISFAMSLWLSVPVATPSPFTRVLLRLDPPIPMMIGTGPVVPVGMLTDTLKLVVLPMCETLTEIDVLLTVPVTISGLPGFGPWMYFSTIFTSSARRHFQSDFLLIF